MPLKFEVIHTSKKSKARVGKIHTAHGTIETPAFVAVGTNGSIKALDSKMVDEIGLQLLFCNTYHLMLQPGSEVVKKAGGLHKFIGRDLPIITDSGGFQVFSLAYGGVGAELKSAGTKKNEGQVLKINEEGVLFRSYRDGSKLLLTPETSVAAQKDLGADIIIPFDELPPYHFPKDKLLESLERTHRWEKRSLDAHLADPKEQSMYAVVHGGIDAELREKSCKELRRMHFDGFAIGGSVGKNRDEMIEMLKNTLPHLPDDRPNHLLGIGDLTSIEAILPLGIDTFDSSYPTKAARHAVAFTSNGNVKLDTKKQIYNFGPIDPSCSCYTCRNYSLSYISHLFKANELTALTLATIHNLDFMVRLMQNYREKILADEY